MKSADRTIDEALTLSQRLTSLGEALLEPAEPFQTAIIGATALAAHGYVRGTATFDLACHVPPSLLSTLASHLRAEGKAAVFHAPDEADPLGGTLTVEGDDFAPVQLVNFLNPLRPSPPVGLDAIRTAEPTETGLRLVGIPHLVALKLYAGGRKGEVDILELLDRHPEVDWPALRDLCRRYGLAEALEKALGDAR